MDPGDLVRALYEAYQDRDWDRASALLLPDAIVDLPATAERLDGRAEILAFQRDYPEPCGVMTVQRALGDPTGAAAQVTVDGDGGARFACAAFWRVSEGLLHHGVEYWITVGAEDPPSSRARSASTLAARRAWVASLDS